MKSFQVRFNSLAFQTWIHFVHHLDPELALDGLHLVVRNALRDVVERLVLPVTFLVRNNVGLNRIQNCLLCIFKLFYIFYTFAKYFYQQNLVNYISKPNQIFQNALLFYIIKLVKVTADEDILYKLKVYFFIFFPYQFWVFL